MPGKWVQTALAVTAATVLLPAPANAATPCPSPGALCLYDGPSFTGTVFTASALNPTGVCVDLTAHGWGGGRVKSAVNRNTKTAVLYTSTNCTLGGPFQYIFPNQLVSPVGLTANSAYVY
ncbi:peptidase inhibitor family I36 protein [Acrocarpospora sp. B8E8]|uniref:peptidase inhibitor family I36 protein n=1 Tax=Acrocarpospora sp. B8E8 TaxID=3153572 RepID=UPI00325D6AFC